MSRDPFIETLLADPRKTASVRMIKGGVIVTLFPNRVAKWSRFRSRDDADDFKASLEFQQKWLSERSGLSGCEIVDSTDEASGLIYVALMMPRLPDTGNLLLRLRDGTLDTRAVAAVASGIGELVPHHERCSVAPRELVDEFFMNIAIEFRELDRLVIWAKPLEGKLNLRRYRSKLLSAFGKATGRSEIAYCHGNINAANAFLVGADRLVTIDPAQILCAVRMPLIGEFAAFYSDLLLFSRPELARAYEEAVLPAETEPGTALLFHTYAVVKTLVRSRIAFGEHSDKTTDRHLWECDTILENAEAALAAIHTSLEGAWQRLDSPRSRVRVAKDGPAVPSGGPGGFLKSLRRWSGLWRVS